MAFIFVSVIIFALVFARPLFQDLPEPGTGNVVVSNKPSTTVFFAGDIMLDRGVKGKISAAGGNANLPFKNVVGEISQADISFANLESPFSDTQSPTQNKMVFSADPKAVSGLNYAGFDILSTANNHTFDRGLAGLTFTYDWLHQKGIFPIGTTESCHEGQIITRNNIKFGFLAYSYTARNDGGNIPHPSVCDANDLRQVTLDIQNLRQQVDILIVSVHMGQEYTRVPNEFGVKFAHNTIDSGADLLIGHHPHWIQKIELYKNKWIFYSLGNFVFDQMWSQDTKEGLTVEINFKGKDVSRIELRPVIIENYCCPRWANETERKSILEKIDLTDPILAQ